MRIFTTKRIAKMVPPAIWVRAGEPIIQLFFESSAKREFGEWNRHSAKCIECARYDPLFTHIDPPIVSVRQWRGAKHFQHRWKIGEIRGK